MTRRPPLPPHRDPGLAAVAAAATPVVAAALLAVAVATTGCDARPATTLGPGPTATTPTSAEPSPAPTAPSSTPAAGGTLGSLVLALGPPGDLRVVIVDPGDPGASAKSVALPPGSTALAAVVAGPDGRLAAVAPDGAAWVTRAGTDAGPLRWSPLAAAGPADPAGPVLGAAWEPDGSGLVLLAGAPGSGAHRAALVRLPIDGAPARRLEVPLEPDGPGLAVLPDGVVAFVGRDLRDRALLARITAAGSYATVPVVARGVAAGGGRVALIDDEGVRVGTVDELEHGILPYAALPLAGPDGIGAVAVAPDGDAVAVVRLDADGAPLRVETCRRRGDGWVADGEIALEPRDGAAAPAWLP